MMSNAYVYYVLYFVGNNFDASLTATTSKACIWVMLANLAQSSQSSILAASIGPVPRSRIRCKMCRQVLATREDMLDHGQLRPAIVPKAESSAAETPSPILNSDKTDQATQDASETIVTSSSDAASEGSNTTVTTPPGTVASSGVTNAPILLNPKCSGYFVEPVSHLLPIVT